MNLNVFLFLGQLAFSPANPLPKPPTIASNLKLWQISNPSVPYIEVEDARPEAREDKILFGAEQLYHSCKNSPSECFKDPKLVLYLHHRLFLKNPKDSEGSVGYRFRLTMQANHHCTPSFR